jgi:hypothetical protein
MLAQRTKVRRSALRGCCLALLLTATSCASVSFERETATSGTFVSTGWAFTILSIDLPKPAINIARENVSDANLANTVVQEVSVIPNLGPFDWLFDIISIRRAQIRGTWGFSGD